MTAPRDLSPATGFWTGCICPWKDRVENYEASSGSSWYCKATRDAVETWRCVACKGTWTRTANEGSIEGGVDTGYAMRASHGAIANPAGHEALSDLDSQPAPCEMCATDDDSTGWAA